MLKGPKEIIYVKQLTLHLENRMDPVNGNYIHIYILYMYMYTHTYTHLKTVYVCVYIILFFDLIISTNILSAYS